MVNQLPIDFTPKTSPISVTHTYSLSLSLFPISPALLQALIISGKNKWDNIYDGTTQTRSVRKKYKAYFVTYCRHSKFTGAGIVA